jgi:phage terminase large subunit-like protein
LKGVITELAARINPSALLVEDKASGQSLIQDLEQSTALPVQAVEPDGDKLMRANICVPTWEAGRVHALAAAPWLDDFLDEVCTFPKAPHDDIVDALVQGLRFLTLAPGAGLIDWYKNQSEQQTEQQAAFAKRPGVVVTELQSPWHTP